MSFWAQCPSNLEGLEVTQQCGAWLALPGSCGTSGDDQLLKVLVLPFQA